MNKIKSNPKILHSAGIVFLFILLIICICPIIAVSQVTFTDVTSPANVGNNSRGMGAGWGDYNNDDFLDLYISNYNDVNVLYKNNGGSNHWIIIKPVGTTSNRAGIGARIEVTTGTNTQIREVDGGSGFCSQDSLWVHFGLGSNEKIGTLKIKWPGGKVQTLSNITADQILAITEE